MKQFNISFLIIFSLFFAHQQLAQAQGSIPLTKENLYNWEKIEKLSIAKNGDWVATEIKPNRGNSKSVFYNPADTYERSFLRAESPEISPLSSFGIFIQKMDFDTAYAYKLYDQNNPKGKKSKEIKDTLCIYNFKSDTLIRFPNYKSHQLAKDSADVLVIAYEKKQAVEDDSEEDKKKKRKKKKKAQEKKEVKKEWVSQLALYTPFLQNPAVFSDVKAYELSRKGNLLLMHVKSSENISDSGSVILYDVSNQSIPMLIELPGEVKHMQFDYNENQVVFMQSTDSVEPKNWNLYHINLKSVEPLQKDLTSSLLALADSNQRLSPHASPFFSKNGELLYFEIQAKPDSTLKDTLLKNDQPNVDVWSYIDPQLQPQQLLNKKRKVKEGLIHSFHLGQEQLQPLETDSHRIHNYSNYKNGPLYLLSDKTPYEKTYSWSYPWNRDYYLLNTESKTKKKILSEQGHPTYLSPTGKFVVYYKGEEKNWYAIELKTGNTLNLTKNIFSDFSQEHHDYPYVAFPEGLVGFGENDDFILLKDQRDIWQISLDSATKAYNLTEEIGSATNSVIAFIKRPTEKNFIDFSEPQLFRATNQNDFSEKLFFLHNGEFKELWSANKHFSRFELAENTLDFIFTEQSFKQSPLVYTYRDNAKSNISPLFETNKQQQNYLWGSVSLTQWQTPGGDSLKGLIYTPDFFDPATKYPMIVYFYRRYSDRIHDYKHIAPSRSIINPAWYTSRGYVVFIPDVAFETAKPGKSAAECVISGTEHMIQQGYINPEKIGIQGHSWGGYQTAYIITQSDQFAAAMAGAPVSNMTSAYGGIRWNSGLSRMFQYERSQSRIGQTLWENREAYIENSPLFYLDKVKTPLLIHHNDEDGAVPWYQGIELFVGMRRLGKPCWMLNYNGEPHNLKKWGPKVDLTLRMQQFFDHYLQDAEAPLWMTVGIPAIQKGKTLGY